MTTLATPRNSNETFRRNVLLILQTTGRSQRWLADRLKISDQAVCETLAGRSGSPVLDTVDRWAKALNIGAFRLMDPELSADEIAAE